MAVMMMPVVHRRCLCRAGRHRRCQSSSSFLPPLLSFPFSFPLLVSSFVFVSSVFVVFISLLMFSFLLSLLSSSFLMSCCCLRHCHGCCLSSSFVVTVACPLSSSSLSLLLSFSLMHLLPLMMMTEGSRWVVVKDVFFLSFLVVC